MSEISNIPRNPLVGLLADALMKARGYAQNLPTVATPGGPIDLAKAAEILIGKKPEMLDDASYGFNPLRGKQGNLVDAEAALEASDLVPGPGQLAKLGKLAVKALAKDLLPGAAPAIFIGSRARGFDSKAAQAAEDMLLAGIHPDDVWKQSGTGKIAGDWIQEISDHKATINWQDPMSTPPGWQEAVGTYALGGHGNDNLGGLYNHPELFKNHPELAQSDALIRHGGPGPYGGQHMAAFDKLGEPLPGTISVRASTPEDALSILAHEGQHGAQHLGQTAGRGASPAYFSSLLGTADPKMPQDLRKRFANNLYETELGEAMARMTQRRLNFDENLRRNIPPWHNADVAQFHTSITTPGRLAKPQNWPGVPQDMLIEGNHGIETLIRRLYGNEEVERLFR